MHEFLGDYYMAMAFISNLLNRYLPFKASFTISFEASLNLFISSIVKQVLTAYLNHSRVRFLISTSTGVLKLIFIF